MAETWSKAPGEKLDYTVDWSARLASGETVTASSWSTTAGITTESTAFTTVSATIWLSGGSSGQVYSLTNTVTTSAGRIYTHRETIKVKDR